MGYDVNFSRVSNCADWVESMQLTDEETGDPLDLDGWSIRLDVVRQSPMGRGDANYQGWRTPGTWNTDWSNSPSPVLTATTANGKITVNAGVVTWRFYASEMQDLEAGIYEVGAIATKSPDTVQLFVGLLPIIEGIAR